MALVKGDIETGEDVLCRVHSECPLEMCLVPCAAIGGQQFAAAMTQIEKEAERHPVVYAPGRQRNRPDQ